MKQPEPQYDAPSDPRVETVRTLVERACAAPTNAFGYGIWSHHIIWVEHYGLELAHRLRADALTVGLAALLHDYAGIRDATLAPEHHRYGAEEAERILAGLEYPEGLIRAVQHCILTHRASRDLKPATLEARCLASADAMAHIAQVPSLLHLAYVRKGMAVDEGASWVRGKLERSYRKLGPEAQEMIAAQYQAALQVLG